MSAVYEKLIPPAKRYELEVIVLQKPHARYVVPVAQAVGNYVGGIFGALSYANRKGYTLNAQQEQQLEQVVRQYVVQALSAVGVTANFDVAQTAGAPLNVSTAVSGPAGNTAFTFTFAPIQVSFKPNRAEMKALAVERYARYIRAITDGDVQRIFELAALGYDQFLSGDTPSEIKAKIKHRIAMERIKLDPASYRQKLNAQRYDAGYDVGTEKYDEMFREVGGSAIMYGFEFAKAVVQVL